MARVVLLIAILAALTAPAADTKQEARAHLARGAAHLQRNEREEAVSELKKAVALDARSAAAHMLLGQAYLAQGSLEMIAEAKAELQQALDLDPDAAWARFYLAKIYLDLGRAEKAKAELERGLLTKPQVPHFLSLLGEVNRRLGSPDSSIQLNRRALDLDPAMNAAHYYLALAYLDLKRDDEASRELERALESKYIIPEMYTTLGSICTREGKLEKAGELFRKAIALDPSRPEGHVKLAEVYRLQRAYDRALAELKLAAPEGKRFPGTEYFQQLQADISFEKGRIYQAQRLPVDAVKAYSQALEIDPNHEKARRGLEAMKKSTNERE